MVQSGEWFYRADSPILEHESGGVVVVGPGIIGTSLDPDSLDRLSFADSHGEAEVGHGRLRDGVGRNELLAYLRADAEYRQQGRINRWGNNPPTVRIASGATPGIVLETRAVVALINSALPQDWQIRFDSTPVSIPSDFADGSIVVTFTPQIHWPGHLLAVSTERTLGWAQWLPGGVGEIDAGLVWIDPKVQGHDRLQIIAHEIIHTLGRGHVSESRFPRTLLNPTIDPPSGYVKGYILHPLDNEALLAVYDQLTLGVSTSFIADDLGPWEQVSTNILGALAAGSLDDSTFIGLFGAAEFTRAWVRPCR